MRVLFIGNSFTQRNDLPGLIAQLAHLEAFETARVVANGASLRQHWNKGEAGPLITQGWDYVVLQEQSTLPIKNKTRFHENVRLFAEPVQNSGAKLALYQTWARAHAPETQQLLNEGYQEIGAELNALVIPVGKYWERALKAHPALPLYDKDGSHPSALGTYLAACVFLKTLLNSSEPGSGSSAELKLDSSQAEVIRGIVWS